MGTDFCKNQPDVFSSFCVKENTSIQIFAFIILVGLINVSVKFTLCIITRQSKKKCGTQINTTRVLLMSTVLQST